jgi:hypothetical protein
MRAVPLRFCSPQSRFTETCQATEVRNRVRPAGRRKRSEKNGVLSPGRDARANCQVGGDYSAVVVIGDKQPFVIVHAGDVGVIYSFGSIIGEVEEGAARRRRKIQGEQRVEAEKGEGEAKLARAEKEALANQKLAASLTPLLVQQR